MHDLIEELEREARERSRTLENQGRLSAGFTAHYYPLTRREEAQGRRARAAWKLAGDLDTLRALLRGERVPRHRLDQTFLAAHERRRRGR